MTQSVFHQSHRAALDGVFFAARRRRRLHPAFRREFLERLRRGACAYDVFSQFHAKLLQRRIHIRILRYDHCVGRQDRVRARFVAAHRNFALFRRGGAGGLRGNDWFRLFVATVPGQDKQNRYRKAKVTAQARVWMIRLRSKLVKCVAVRSQMRICYSRNVPVRSASHMSSKEWTGSLGSAATKA